MSDNSANLSLPFIQPSQAQKHVTHNQGMLKLDALVQLSVLAMDQTDPPATPLSGDRYILPAGTTGAWAGQTGKVAVYQENTWEFLTAGAGWTAWVEALGEHRVFDGSNWMEVPASVDFQNLEQVGINTTADAANRLSVSSAATLFSHEGAGHQLKLNKNAVSDTASLLFQTNWSGRAEMGLAGNDDFAVKVSPDGSTWHSGLVVDRNSGEVNFPAGATGLTPAEFGSGAIINVDYIASKGADLITNGTGLLGNNYNMPAPFIWDGVISPNLPASFRCSGYYPGLVTTSELLSVNPHAAYRLESFVRQEGYAHLQYMGIVLYDADLNRISASDHMRYRDGGTDSMTTLAAPLTPGDTTVSISDATGWNATDSNQSRRGIIIFEHKNNLGYKYDFYSRIWQYELFDVGGVDKTTNTITLNQPFPSAMANPDDANGTWPTGTRLANTNAGGSYKYMYYANLTVPALDSWYKTRAFAGGLDTSGLNTPWNFSPGTAYARVMWLPNYSNRSGGWSGHPDSGSTAPVWFAGISVVPEPMTKIVNEANGSKTLYTPQVNSANSGMEIVLNAASTVEEAE